MIVVLLLFRIYRFLSIKLKSPVVATGGVAVKWMRQFMMLSAGSVVLLLAVSIHSGAQQYLPEDRRGNWQQAGSLRFFKEKVKVTRINRLLDYGADSTGAQPTQNVRAFRAALADRSSTGITMIFISRGTYSLDSIIQLDSMDNVIISGEGSAVTRLNFFLNGADNQACFSVHACDTIGIENICIERCDNANYGDNISFVHTNNSWVAGVESFKAVSANISIYFSTHVEIRGCCIHHAWNYDQGGNGYGVVIGGNSTAVLIEDNIFYHLRHSVILSNGSFENVIGYNYSTEPYTTEKYLGVNDWPSDMCLHGHPDDFPGPSRNLFEGNLCAFMHADDAWDDNGPYNTYFRNKATYYGLRIYKASNSQNVVANEVTDRDGSLADMLWNAFDIESNNNFILGNSNYDADPDKVPSEGEYSADLSLYLKIDSLPPFLGTLPYFPPFGAVDKEHLGGGTIPAVQRRISGGITTVKMDHSTGIGIRPPPPVQSRSNTLSRSPIRYVTSGRRVDIQLTIDSPSAVRLTFYTLSGHLVRTIHAGKCPAGIKIVLWDGTDDHGHPVPSGQYLCSGAIGTIKLHEGIVLLP